MTRVQRGKDFLDGLCRCHIERDALHVGTPRRNPLASALMTLVRDDHKPSLPHEELSARPADARRTTCDRDDSPRHYSASSAMSRVTLQGVRGAVHGA